MRRLLLPLVLLLAMPGVAAAQAPAPAQKPPAKPPAAAAAAPAAQPLKDPVVATVNGQPIRLSELEIAQQALPQQYRNMPLQAVFPALLDRIVDSKLVVQEGKKSKVTEDPAFKKRMAFVEDQVLQDFWIQREVARNVTPEKLQQRYEERLKSMPSEEEVHARHILVLTEDEAKAIIADLKKGAAFDKLAKEKSTDKASGAECGDLGWFKKSDMVKEFADAAKNANPPFKMGGTGSKREDHVLTVFLEKKTGAKFASLPYKSGGEAATQLVGNHTQSNVNNPSENLEVWRAGQVRPLCVFDKERMQYKTKVTDSMSWNDIPTCKDQGVDVQYLMLRAMFLPGKVTPEQTAFYVDLFSKLTQTSEYKEYMEKQALKPVFLTGKDMLKFLEEDDALNRNLMTEAGFVAN